jgi:predicted  nucleic acid-binding Zn-ribbon protein|nr:MAG TPA: minor structural protein [Bacteriophage sp.]
MNVAEELCDLKRALETAKENRDRAQGKLEVLHKQLEEYGFTSIEELQNAISELKSSYEKKKVEIQEKIDEFKRKYGDMLND